MKMNYHQILIKYIKLKNELAFDSLKTKNTSNYTF